MFGLRAARDFSTRNPTDFGKVRWAMLVLRKVVLERPILPPHIRQSLPRPGKDTSPRQFHESAIGQHLLDNAQCASSYNQDKFSVLARARTPFHLSALEATFIKSLNTLLCKQKEFVSP